MKSMKIFICEDCTVVFQVYGMNRKKHHFCPSCADHFAVVPYQAERQSETNTKIRWTAEELDLIKEVIKGNYQPYQVAILIGRSTNAVVKKANRVKKDIQHLKATKK